MWWRVCCGLSIHATSGLLSKVNQGLTHGVIWPQGFSEMDVLAEISEATLGDGQFWRLRLHSPGASSLLLLFRWSCALPLCSSLPLPLGRK